MNLEACIPPDLQGPSTTIAKVAAGLSGAGVYRVDANGAAYALKISDPHESAERWRSKLHIQQMASDAGLAPRIVHADESRRAVVSEFLVDHSFPAQFFNPATREAAFRQLGETLRRVHDLPLDGTATWRDPRVMLADTARNLDGDFVVPAFVAEAIRWGISHEPPPPDRAEVLSHNDVNPSNLLFDGARLMLLDWEVAGRNDPYYDLAAISVFFRMDADTCRKLIEIHDGTPCAELSARFLYVRRFIATLLGAVFMTLARAGGHPGAQASDTLESVMPLAEFFQQLRAGTLNIASGDGQVAFALALIKESFAL